MQIVVDYQRMGWLPSRQVSMPIADVKGETALDTLERVFTVLQGDQSFPRQLRLRSLSVGDTVTLADGKRYRCEGSGWSLIG